MKNKCKHKFDVSYRDECAICNINILTHICNLESQLKIATECLEEIKEHGFDCCSRNTAQQALKEMSDA